MQKRDEKQKPSSKPSPKQSSRSGVVDIRGKDFKDVLRKMLGTPAPKRHGGAH